MTTKHSEAQIEESILQWLNSSGFFSWKNPTAGFYDTKSNTFRKQASTFALNGISDIIAIRQGVVYFIEVKTILGTQSMAQKSFECKIKENGGNYLLVRSVEDVKSFFLIDSIEDTKLLITTRVPRGCGGT